MAVCISHAAFSFLPADSTRDHYIESYRDRFYLKPIYTIRNLKMVIRSRATDSKINYLPNGNAYFGLGIYFFDIGVEGSIKLPENADSYNIFGKTEFFDFQSNIYAKKWGADIAIQQYDGFYIKNPFFHYMNWQPGDPLPQRPDLEVNQVLINGFYFLNHRKFSYRSAYNQADRQRKSGGTILIGINFVNQEISADTSLIPGESQNLYNKSKFNNSHLTALGILGGYTYTFVKHDFYLNFSLTAGPAHVWSEYQEYSDLKYKNHVTPLLNFRGALGYNSPRWFAGLTYVNQQSNLLSQNLDIKVESGNIKLFFGYRFKEVGILKKELF